MVTTIIGNIIGLIGAACMIICGNLKDKRKAVIAQTAQATALSISNLVLGGISGFIINLIGAIRNILSYKNKLNKPLIAIIIVVSAILTICFNNLGPIGYLPLVGNTIFILFMNTKSNINFKILTIVFLIPWTIYDIYIKGYTTAIFSTISIISCIVTIFRIKKSEKQTAKNK